MEVCDKFPNCQAGEVAKEQIRQKNELHDKMAELSLDLKDFSLGYTEDLKSFSLDMKDFSKTMTSFGIQMSDIRQYIKELSELKLENKEAHDFFGEELRRVKELKADNTAIEKIEQSIEAMKNERMSFKTKLIIVGISTTIALLTFMAGFILNGAL